MQIINRTLNRFTTFAFLVALAIGVTGVASMKNAFAGSITSLSTSIGSLSTSVGSSSTSFEKSSDSSFGLTAQGPYEVTEMVAMDDRPGFYRLALKALQPGVDDLWLILQRDAAQKGQIQVGTIVHAQAREYGVAFAVHSEAGDNRPFFLVLRDEWFRELDSRLVSL